MGISDVAPENLRLYKKKSETWRSGMCDVGVYPQMTQMVTDGGPQADFVGELLLTNDEGLFASSSSCASS